MKKIYSIIFFIVFSNIVIAQKVYHNPDYISSNFSGRVTKIEIFDTKTILHFKYEAPIGSSFSIPPRTYIEDALGEGKRMFLTKRDGITTGRNVINNSGEIRYKLYFPPLKGNVTKINYGEANKEGTWHIFKIDITKNGHKFLTILKPIWLLEKLRSWGCLAAGR